MEPAPQLPTHFAPAERASMEELRRQAELCLGNPVSLALLEAVSGHALILNAERQVVAANPEALEALGMTHLDAVCGLRMGEAFHCEHAKEGPGGCGTSRACSQCGALLSVLGSQSEGVPVGGECLLSMKRGQMPLSREYKVRSSPIELGGQRLSLLILQDMSGQKRREVLEHLVFHDFQGVMTGVDVRMQHLVAHPEQASITAQQIQEMTAQMGEELTAQRILLSAEEGQLVADPRDLAVQELFSELDRRFRGLPIAAGREWRVDPGQGGLIHTDPVLLNRALTNLLRNAFEAIPAGKAVRMLCRRGSDGFRFEVRNSGQISAPVSLRVFQRSFSTKAAKGRGLGTYATRLMVEGFLGGRVGFENGPEETCFYVELPARLDASQPHPQPEVLVAPPPPEPLLQGMACGASTVLVVDDSRTIRNLLARTLGREHRVITAADGHEALRMAVEQQPDLVLLDAVMPGLDGFATCARLKSDPRTEEIPVLFLSGLAGDDDETLALEAGAIDFIPKPIRPVVVAARVRNQLELKRSRDRLRDLTLLDGLTGIANRRRFDRQMQTEWLRAQRSMTPLSVILGDVDFFKRYNDGYGHAQGDECLKAVAGSFVQALLRPADLAARYGGEEFVCILPDTPLEGAMEVAERIRQCLKAAGLPHAHSEAGPLVTLSLGVAQARSGEQDPMDLLRRADQKLYEAKQQGRDRVQG